MTPMKCKSNHKWRAHDMHDVWCKKCGAVGVIDTALIERQRAFDAREHMMIDRVTGQPKAGDQRTTEEPSMKAMHQRRTGFRDYEVAPDHVTILGFVEATIEPGYQRHGTKKCIVAVIAKDDGRLGTAELDELTLVK